MMTDGSNEKESTVEIECCRERCSKYNFEDCQRADGLPRDCLLLTATALELRQKKPMEEEGIQEEVKQAELLDAACSIQIRTPTV